MAPPSQQPHPFRPGGRDQPLPGRLACFPFLDELEPRALGDLASRARAVRFAQETSLVSCGDAVALVPLVERGAIRVERTQDDGKRIALYRVGPGESCVLALSGAIRGERYPAEAIAEAGTDAILVPADSLRAEFERQSALRRFVLDLYSARLFDLMHLVREVRFERIETRLARLLLREAEAGPGMTKPISLSHAEIAARLGTAREVVSRVLARLRDSNAVALHRGRIEVLDAAALEALTRGPPT